MPEWNFRAAVAVTAVAALVTVVAYTLVRHDPRSRCASTAQRREQQRQARRQQKDLKVQKKKQLRANDREKREQSMTEEQKREQMERIKMQRVEQYQKLDDGLLHGVRVVVDLAFASGQTQRECHSVLKQLGCVYGYLKKCPLDRTLSLRVASYTGAVATLGQSHGVPSWKIHVHAEPLHEVYPVHEIVYLSPDASDVLTTLDPQAVYVVGGIVDRSVRKGQSLDKATAHGARVMRLPLQEYMTVHKHVLNIDAVLIALNEFANHRSWTRAFQVAIPKRMATLKENNMEKSIE